MRPHLFSRRRFLSGALFLPALPPAARAAARFAGPLRITRIEAVRFHPELRIEGIAPNWMWVRLHTDAGLVGTGETYPGYEAHAGALRELARFLLGRDATEIERIWQDLYYQISYRPVGGAEFRVLCAVNIAQWDLLGQAAGLPVWKLLGGRA